MFGDMNLIDALAGGDVTKYNAVLDIDCRTALVKMTMIMEERNYKKRLYNILNKRK